MYYTTEAYFKNKFDNAYKPYAFRARSPEEYKYWKKDFRIILAGLLGFDKMIRCVPNPQLISTEKMDGYIREKMVIDTEP